MSTESARKAAEEIHLRQKEGDFKMRVEELERIISAACQTVAPPPQNEHGNIVCVPCGQGKHEECYMACACEDNHHGATSVASTPHLDTDYIFKALIAASESLPCSCAADSDNAPCPSCAANHASALIDEFRKQSSALAATPPSSESEVMPILPGGNVVSGTASLEMGLAVSSPRCPPKLKQFTELAKEYAARYVHGEWNDEDVADFAMKMACQFFRPAPSPLPDYPELVQDIEDALDMLESVDGVMKLRAQIAELQTALREAVADIREHCSDYHYRTSKESLDKWTSLAALSPQGESK